MSTDRKAARSGSKPSTPNAEGAEPGKTKQASASAGEQQNTLRLAETEAWAGSPDDFAVCGEEDPGAGLEFLVSEDRKDKRS